MLDIAVLNPGSHQARIMEAAVPSLGLNPLSETLRAFGIEVGSQMVTLPARQLSGPSVEYRAKKKLTVNDGAWNLVGSKFYQGAAMGKVPVLLLSDGPTNNYSGPNDPELRKVRPVLCLFEFISMMICAVLLLGFGRLWFCLRQVWHKCFEARVDTSAGGPATIYANRPKAREGY